MEDFIWLKRSKQWIKENPGKGTMHKSPRVEFIKKPDISASAHRKKVYAEKTKTEYDPQKGRDAGIYVICCERSKHAYIGQSTNMDVRLKSHKMNVCGTSQSKARAYDKMREHFREFGMESFYFKKHIAIPFADTHVLCDTETKTMHEFLDKGYTLYNKEIDYGTSIIYCPSSIRDIIKKVIEKAKTNPELIERIRHLL